jgi:hypothetical protein
MPVDPQGSSRDRAKALATVAFMILAFIAIYVVAKTTGNSKPSTETATTKG